MKKRYIVIACLIAILLCSGIYIKALFDQYPQIELEEDMLYGEDKSNLKDFVVDGDGLLSTSNDPWIIYSLDKSTKVKVIELDFSEVTQDGQWGEVYNAETWTSNRYYLKNGKILLFYDEPEELEDLRFDLVAYQSVHLKIDAIKVNSQLGLVKKALEKIVFLSIYIILMGVIIYLLIKYLRKYASNIAEKVVAVILTIVPAMLGGIYVYNRLIYHIEITISVWMLVLLFGMLILSMTAFLSHYEKKQVYVIQVCVFIVLNFGLIELVSGMEYNYSNLMEGIWNVVLVGFLLLLLFLILRNMKLAMIFTNIPILILGIANHYFYLFRGNPLEMSDIMVAETAVSVLGNYEFKINNTLLYCIIIEFGILCCIQLSCKIKIDKKIYQVCSVVVLALFCGIVSNEPGVSYWNMVSDTKSCGYLNSFVAYARHDLKSTKPEGYSEKIVEEILSSYEEPDISQIEDEDKPNVIVIMNEAFSDLPTTYDFDTKKDGMPFIHSLDENTIKGNMMVSVFGGGTANTEYEFLTGNSIAFFNSGSVPYMQFVKRTQESLAWDLKNMGYQTIAFHPYEPGNYQRDKVYPRLGFDTFISNQDDLKYTDRLRAYMSDEADMKNLIDIYNQNKQNGPVFIFNVTMQNHGDYNRTESELEASVKPVDKDLQQYTQLLEYLALIKETDSAFQELVTYFQGIDDKTIILMYGDHQPGLDSDIFSALLEIGSDDEAADSLLNGQTMHTVPFVMWANYDIEEEKSVLTSPNYLREMLLHTANLPLSRYEQFQVECAAEYPAINSLGFYDKNGNLHGMDESVEDIDILHQYQILQYANIFDKSEKKNFE